MKKIYMLFVISYCLLSIASLAHSANPSREERAIMAVKEKIENAKLKDLYMFIGRPTYPTDFTYELQFNNKPYPTAKYYSYEYYPTIIQWIKEYILKQHGELTSSEKDSILKGQLWIGMTKEQALLSKGKPEDIHSTNTAYGSSEQWVYDIWPKRGQLYLYFEDDKLTSWQD